MSTVLAGPFLGTAQNSAIGVAYRNLPGAIRQQLVERQSIRTNGLLVFGGDLAGASTKTLRARRGTGWGASRAMATMASETETIPRSSVTVDTDEWTYGRHGIRWGESFEHAMLDDADLDIDALAASAVDTYDRTLLDLACTTGATISTNSADDAAQLDVDDVFALRADFEETEGFEAMGAYSMLHPVQITHLRNSMRSETALKFPERFDRDQALQNNYGKRFTFLDIEFYGSNRVLLSGGDYYGFAAVRGALVWVVCSTGGLGDISDANPTLIPELGIVMTRRTDGAAAIKDVHVNAFTGVNLDDPTIAPQFLMRSQG